MMVPGRMCCWGRSQEQECPRPVCLICWTGKARRRPSSSWVGDCRRTRTIEQRERHGVYDHILVFHELPQSVDLLSRLIPELKKRGYAFVSLQQYMEAVGGKSK